MDERVRRDLLRNETVYICAPMRDCQDYIVYENQIRAKRYGLNAMERYGCRALAPQAYLPELLDLDDPIQYGVSLWFREKLMNFCSVVLVCGPSLTEEMRQELSLAIQKGLLIMPLPENEAVTHRFIAQRGLGWEVIV